MKTPSAQIIYRRPIVEAVAGALASFAVLSTSVAMAADQPTVAELTAMDRTLEVGAMDVSRKSLKFGEYNGLDAKGGSADINFKIGGKGDEDSTLRWTAEGSNLGLDTRRFQFDGGQQGIFNFRFVYDELPHQISDTYRTIFNGNGTTTLTLPSNYPAAATRNGYSVTAAGTTSNQGLGNWNNVQAPNSGNAGVADLGGPGYLIPSLMHNVDVGTKRTKLDGGVGFALMPGWDAKITLGEEKKTGTKLTGYAFNSASTAATVVEPISFKTNTFSLALTHSTEKANLNATYTYSSFKNDISAWTAATPFAGAGVPVAGIGVYNNLALFSSAPENQMHQFKLAGGYRFDGTTRLAYELGSSRSFQNSRFNCQVDNAGTACVSGVNGWVIPSSSADAKVRNDLALFKLSTKPMRDLSLFGSYKYDNRDNQTPVRTFTVSFADANAAAATAITNDPINTKKGLLDLGGEYSFARAQTVKLGVQQERIRRTTDGNGYAPSRVQSTANSNDFSIPVHNTRESTALIEYRNTMVQDLTGRLAYSYSSRKAEDYAAPVFAATTNTATLLSNAYYQNFRDFYVADRKRDKLRGSLNFQASEAWSLGASLDFNKDTYTNAALKEAKSTILNLDASYSPIETLSINPYYSYEDRKSSLTGKYIINTAVAGATLNGANAAVLVNGGAACNTANTPCILANWDWGLAQADKVSTLGIATKYSGLMSGRLDTKADLLYVYSKTPVTASGGGSVISDGAAVPNYVSVPVTNFPDITSKTLQLRLTGTYKIDKTQSVRVAYLFQKLRSADWQYDAYSNPIAMQAMIGTGITSPSYTVNAIGASYIYRFE